MLRSIWPVVCVFLTASCITPAMGKDAVGLQLAQVKTGMVGRSHGPSRPNFFTAFFSAGEAKLSGPGQSVVEGAAQIALEEKPTRILVTGHTDGVENSMPLSEQRAREVAKALVGRGVPARLISVRWKGAGEPSAHTAAAEPLNRRVTIEMTFAG